MNRRTLLKGLFGGAIAGKVLAESKPKIKKTDGAITTNGSSHLIESEPVYVIEHDMSDYKPICCQHRHIRAVYTVGQGMSVECADCGELKPCITQSLNGGMYEIIYDKEMK